MSEHILARQNTQWMQGVSAIMIMLMHFVMQTEHYPRFLNILESLGVAVFLFVSGFGINESYRDKGLDGFWRKRITRVILPCWIVFLFALSFEEGVFDISRLLRNLLFTDSDLWFVDYIIRWYIVYWIGRKFMPKYTLYVLMAFGAYNIFQMQLCSEQAFSFVCGFVVSEYYNTIKKIRKSTVLTFCSALWLYGCGLMIVKELDCVQLLKGTLPFNFLLLNIKLPLATFIIVLPYLVPVVKRMTFVSWIGRLAYELYIVHYNFIPYISGYVSILLYSLVSIGISYVFEKINVLMRQCGNFLRTFAAVLFIGMCFFLLCKYAMRVTDHYGWISIGYAVVMAYGYIIMQKTNKALAGTWIMKVINRHSNVLFYILAGVFLVAAFTLQYSLDPLQNNVDRWSAIEYPIRDLFDGKFPYLANTHLGGNASPFPVWMVFHIPFYLLGNVGLSEIFGAMFFVLSIKHIYGNKSGMVAMIMIMACVCVWYEIAVRSDLITNFFLLAAFINYTVYYNWKLDTKTICLSVCCGLWLSTRLSVAFPLFRVLFPQFVKLGVSKKVTVLLLSVATFALTFVPLALWDGDSLFGATNNPFSLQFRQGSPIDTILLAIIAIIMALTWNGNKQRLFVYIAVILILIPVIAYTHTMYTCNEWVGLYYSRYDITYLDAAIPFCITIIASAYKCDSLWQGSVIA